MKKLLFISTISLSFFNYSAHAMDFEEAREDGHALTRPTAAATVVQDPKQDVAAAAPVLTVAPQDDAQTDLPPDVIHQVVTEYPEILPQVMLTCKAWLAATRDLWEATSGVYYRAQKLLSTSSCVGVHLQPTAFRNGFRTLVFKPGDKNDIVAPHKIIRHLIKADCNRLDPKTLAEYQDCFIPIETPNKYQKFSHLKLFLLNHAQQSMDIKVLTTAAQCQKNLEIFINTENPNHCHYQNAFVNTSYPAFSLEMFIKSFQTGEQPYPEGFKSLYVDMLRLYRLALANNKCYGDVFFDNPSSGVVLRAMHDTPVTFENGAENMRFFLEKTRQEISRLLTQYWQTSERTKAYLRVG